MENGVSTVVVRGRSYLDAVAADKRGGSGSNPINLEGRDAGIQRVLDHHGVTLSACLQTFDVMQVRKGCIRHTDRGSKLCTNSLASVGARRGNFVVFLDHPGIVRLLVLTWEKSFGRSPTF